MANKLTICGDLSASGNIYGTIPGANHVNTNCGTNNTWSGSGAFNSIVAGTSQGTAYGYRALYTSTDNDYNSAFVNLPILCLMIHSD